MRIASRILEQLSAKVTEFTGSSAGFALALTLILAWAIVGPFFRYSEMWQMVVNSGTNIITFLMVFLIQRSQNKDVSALHAKLNELIASSESASNRLVNIERLDEEGLRNINDRFMLLSDESDTTTQRKSIEDLHNTVTDTVK